MRQPGSIKAYIAGYTEARDGKGDFGRLAFLGEERRDYFAGRSHWLRIEEHLRRMGEVLDREQEIGWSRGEHLAEARAVEAYQEAKHGDI